MPVQALDGLWTLVAALLAIALGQRLNRLAPLARARQRAAGGERRPRALARPRGTRAPRACLDLTLRDGAARRAAAGLLRVAGLRRAPGPAGVGRQGALVICLAVLLAIAGQNFIGIASARLFGEPAALGPVPWQHRVPGRARHRRPPGADAPAAAGVAGGFTVGIGSATLGLVLGGLAAGPIAMWLAQRGARRSAPRRPPSPARIPGRAREPAFSSDRWLPSPALDLHRHGASARCWAPVAAARGLQVPGFLAVLLSAVVITNVADLLRGRSTPRSPTSSARSRCGSSSPSPCCRSTGRRW
ncbi:MAG: hypothetical protein MZW92_44245 [Comamonadaceae bacterium]|nr:hypothetical protein [Comamonadaceae bacterium]